MPVWLLGVTVIYEKEPTCINLKWENGWIWWNTVKMSNFTTFLQNEMLTLQNAWLYMVLAVRLKKSIKQVPKCIQTGI